MLKHIYKFLNEYKEYFVLIFLLLVSLFVLSLNESTGVKKVKTYAFGTFAFVSSGFEAVKSVFQDEDELENMRKMNARLMLEVNKLRGYALENSELKKMLGLKDTSSFPLISGSIISKSISSVQGNIIINIGRKEGVHIGMPVINFQGLIGLVINVSEDFSVVRTLMDQNMKIAVEIQRTGISGILTWNGSHNVIKNIAATNDIDAGDRVVTSFFSTIVPPSIPIGIISETEAKTSDVLSRVVIKPFVDFSKIKNVYVVKIIEDKTIDNFHINLMK